jgi:hypothetical protein
MAERPPPNPSEQPEDGQRWTVAFCDECNQIGSWRDCSVEPTHAARDIEVVPASSLASLRARLDSELENVRNWEAKFNHTCLGTLGTLPREKQLEEELLQAYYVLRNVAPLMDPASPIGQDVSTAVADLSNFITDRMETDNDG